MNWPAYLALHASGELKRRAEEAVAALGSCRLCPRNCGVDRLADRKMACKVGRKARVSAHFAHFGEEDCLRGYNGMGWVARELGPDTYVNVMDQYSPDGRVLREPQRFPELTRPLSQGDFQRAVEYAREAGLRRLDERRPHRRLLERRGLFAW